VIAKNIINKFNKREHLIIKGDNQGPIPQDPADKLTNRYNNSAAKPISNYKTPYIKDKMEIDIYTRGNNMEVDSAIGGNSLYL
jgi:hypothetical protein